ncbi:MAG: hypothetical protein E7198_04430 [Schwartzia succinivorans]|jgi:hypothetical protein|uniref:hypothetical protein n=1 Tax=Schwartzia succinivorans TaxID=55507 RepID=UPI0023577FC7|nr:hypothetical protein [Schwartzia succinivorans]MBE6097031.1 hypothetical protein [Schwartzia succinivorans]
MNSEIINLIRTESKSKSSDALDKIIECCGHMKEVGINGRDIDSINGYVTVLVTQAAKEEVAELLERQD